MGIAHTIGMNTFKGHYYLADNIADNVSLGMGSITLEKYAHLRYLYDDESDDIRVQHSVCRNREDCHSLRRWRGY